MVAQTRLEDILINIINGTLDTWLVGKNLFNIYKFNSTNPKIRRDNDVIYIDHGYYVPTNLKFAEIFPLLKVGDNFVIDFLTTGHSGITLAQFIYLTQPSEMILSNGVSYMCTGDMMISGVIIYGNIEDASYIKNIKLEIGSTATPYTSYAFNSELEEAYYEAFGGE